MKYGYFDDENREYVITRPDTPAPWANYLGSTDYGAIISNSAGGYSFASQGQTGVYCATILIISTSLEDTFIYGMMNRKITGQLHGSPLARIFLYIRASAGMA